MTYSAECLHVQLVQSLLSMSSPAAPSRKCSETHKFPPKLNHNFTEPRRDMKKVICYNLFKQIVICLNKLLANNKLQFVQTNYNLFEQIVTNNFFHVSPGIRTI